MMTFVLEVDVEVFEANSFSAACFFVLTSSVSMGAS